MQSFSLSLLHSTPLEYGGLGLTPFYIGTALGCFGIINAIFQAKFLGVGILSFLVSFSMYPIMKYFAQKAGGVGTLVWICIVVHLASEAGLFMAYGKELGLILHGLFNARSDVWCIEAIQVLIVQSVPEGGLMGTANGFGQMLASGMRTIAPSHASSLFSISLQRNLAGGNLVYYVFPGLTSLGVRVSLLLVEPPTREESTRGWNFRGSDSHL